MQCLSMSQFANELTVMLIAAYLFFLTIQKRKMGNYCIAQSTDLVIPKIATVNIYTDEYGYILNWLDAISEPKQNADINLAYQISVALTSFKNRVYSLIEQRRLFNSTKK